MDTPCLEPQRTKTPHNYGWFNWSWSLSMSLSWFSKGTAFDKSMSTVQILKYGQFRTESRLFCMPSHHHLTFSSCCYIRLLLLSQLIITFPMDLLRWSYDFFSYSWYWTILISFPSSKPLKLLVNHWRKGGVNTASQLPHKVVPYGKN